MRVSKNGKEYIMARLSDKSGSIDILFFKREPKQYNQRFSKNPPPPPPQSLEEIMAILENGKPVLINADIKISDDKRVSLFGNRIELLSLNTQLGTNMYIQINEVDAVRSLKKTINSLPAGYTSINFQVIENGKKIDIIIPDKKHITTETLELFKVIPNIKFHF